MCSGPLTAGLSAGRNTLLTRGMKTDRTVRLPARAFAWLGRRGAAICPVLRKQNTSRVSAKHWPKVVGKVEEDGRKPLRKLSRLHQGLGAGSV